MISKILIPWYLSWTIFSRVEIPSMTLDRMVIIRTYHWVLPKFESFLGREDWGSENFFFDIFIFQAQLVESVSSVIDDLIFKFIFIFVQHMVSPGFLRFFWGKFFYHFLSSSFKSSKALSLALFFPPVTVWTLILLALTTFWRPRVCILKA